MKINKSYFYAIIKIDDKNIIVDWFNWRVYTGRYVTSAYKQIKNKEDYKIYRLAGLQEVESE